MKTKSRVFKETFDPGENKVITRVFEYESNLQRRSWNEDFQDKEFAIVKFLETMSRNQVISMTEDGETVTVYYEEW